MATDDLADHTPTIDHPPHYGGDVPHETYRCLHAWGLEGDALLWNAVKYISRAGKKGDKLTDLQKALWYLNLAIERAAAGSAAAPATDGQQ